MKRVCRVDLVTETVLTAVYQWDSSASSNIICSQRKTPPRLHPSRQDDPERNSPHLRSLREVDSPILFQDSRSILPVGKCAILDLEPGGSCGAGKTAENRCLVGNRKSHYSDVAGSTRRMVFEVPVTFINRDQMKLFSVPNKRASLSIPALNPFCRLQPGGHTTPRIASPTLVPRLDSQRQAGSLTTDFSIESHKQTL